MNKLVPKPKAEPLHPSPDFKNRSKIQGTASPVRQVKLFLQNAKHAHRENRGATGSSAEERLRYSSTEEVLRKRIDELELENNEFRSLASDYELLAERNRSLEAQMLLLLDELEEEHAELGQNSLTHQRRAHSKDQNNTTESSHDHSPPQPGHEDSARFGHSSRSQQIKIVNAFDSSDEQEGLVEENTRLRAENERVQGLIDHSIREAIAQLEQRFMTYVSDLEQKLAALAAGNRQAALMVEREDSSKSSSENLRVARERRGSEDRESSEHSGFSLNPRKTLQLQLQSHQKEEDESKVDIKLSYLSESNRSFGNHNPHRMPQNSPNSFFKSIEFVDSELPAKLLFQETSLEQAFQHLAALRPLLAAALALTPAPSHLAHPYRTLEADLRDLLATYFPRTALEEQNGQLRRRVAELSSQAGRAQFLRVEGSGFGERPASQLYLEQSYYLSLQPQQFVEFEESKRKLGEVIEVVRSFNRDYRHLLSESSRGSLLLISHGDA